MENRMQCCRLVGAITRAPSHRSDAASLTVTPNARNSLL